MSAAHSRHRWLTVVIVAWSSFAAAAVATMVFFATFDPRELARAATFPFDLGRPAGYTLGFFFFWALTAGASAISVFLMRSIDIHERHRADVEKR